jgi:hypothetical protein
MNLWGEIPITDTIQPYYLKNVPLKKAYFQGGGGVNQPEPKKKKYKVEPKILDQARFKEPFYHNYDAYEVEGVSGEPKLGPGAGWHHMDKYDSIADFLKDKRKHMKNKYVAEDFYVEDNSKNYKERVKKMKTRASIFNKIVKIALDFQLDEYSSPETYSGDGGLVGANIVGGLSSRTPENDPDNKSKDALNFAQNLDDGSDPENLNNIEEMFAILQPSSHGTFGLPDGVDMPDEDLMPNNISNPNFGIQESESVMFEDKWNI